MLERSVVTALDGALVTEIVVEGAIFCFAENPGQRAMRVLRGLGYRRCAFSLAEIDDVLRPHGSLDATHAEQAPAHQRLLSELGNAIGEFFRELKNTNEADRVRVMTFSEFGRRVEENGSNGTDHGTAGPMFLFGAGITGGMYICERASCALWFSK